MTLIGLSFRILSRWALLAMALAVAGCSSFHREWKSAGRVPAPATIEGRWQGRWRSEETRHTDDLRCLITRTTNNVYLARFHAKYRAVFHISVGYTVPLTVEALEGHFQFEGSANLGAMAGGLYSYKGHATATNLFSTYSCKYDHGVFEMTRPPPERQ